MKKLVAFLFFCLALLPPAGALSTETQSDRLHAYLRQGIESSFNLDHAGAISSFQKAVELDPESPTGYAFLALARLFSYEMGFDPLERQKSQEEMLRYIDNAVTRGEKRIAKNPRDAQAYFALTLAKIVQVRLAIAQRSYLTVATESSNAFRRERKQAEEYYRRTLEVEGGEGVAQVDARQYLKAPYPGLPKNQSP